MVMDNYEDADDFLKTASEVDPEKWAYLEEEFPVLSKHDYIRAKYGEPIGRRMRREGKKGGVPRNKRRKWDDDDWEEMREKRRQYYRDFAEEERYAKELADEGM